MLLSLSSPAVPCITKCLTSIQYNMTFFLTTFLLCLSSVTNFKMADTVFWGDLPCNHWLGNAYLQLHSCILRLPGILGPFTYVWILEYCLRMKNIFLHPTWSSPPLQLVSYWHEFPLLLMPAWCSGYSARPRWGDLGWKCHSAILE